MADEPAAAASAPDATPAPEATPSAAAAVPEPDASASGAIVPEAGVPGSVVIDVAAADSAAVDVAAADSAAADAEVQDEEPPDEEGAVEDEGGAGEGSDERILKVTSQQQVEATDEKSEKKIKETIGDVIDIRRDSFVDATGVPKVARFLNTYRLDPIKPYNPEKVIDVLKEVMVQAFEAFTGYKLDEEGEVTDAKYCLPYNPDLCAKQAKWASDAIRTKLKGLEFRRYKFIVIVTMGEKHNQDIFSCCRFLWDFERDNYTTFTMENTVIYGYVMVFALYYE